MQSLQIVPKGTGPPPPKADPVTPQRVTEYILFEYRNWLPQLGWRAVRLVKEGEVVHEQIKAPTGKKG